MVGSIEYSLALCYTFLSSKKLFIVTPLEKIPLNFVQYLEKNPWSSSFAKSSNSSIFSNLEVKYLITPKVITHIIYYLSSVNSKSVMNKINYFNYSNILFDNLAFKERRLISSFSDLENNTG